ncbi:class I SAM-dependent methyltransferase [Promicromonospora citrea]|uniref:Methyltransferase type 11 n=1 Tax=Promicromonospora citrea TaxID=43677 RepID=A0A8H9L1U3_9MICO|nr:class I SAM-dependent methyltransferase [Promicromonospora citrea]NNH52902.1 class I SAM-dependent methyltransferase [Promicromonospora citrea]GGM08904.1 methyltransferase type 11 [Promicromonospora citrea]
MPTPSVPDGVTGSHLHRGAAEGFGADAARYDRARPVTPQEVADAVLSYAAGGPLAAPATPGAEGGARPDGARPAPTVCPDAGPAARPRVLDVGIGTGLSALPFRAAGADVLGVEVDPRMAEVARGRGLTVEVARFEEWSPAGRTFDAVVSGMTWHWIDPVAGAAQAARVLRDAGVLAVFWHAADLPPGLRSAFHDLYSHLLAGTPGAGMYAPGTSAADGYEAMLDRAAAGLAEAGGFAPPERLHHVWQRRYTAAEWLDQVPTSGGFGRLPGDVRRQVLDGVGAALERDEDVTREGSFAVRHTTVLLAARRSR